MHKSKGKTQLSEGIRKTFDPNLANEPHYEKKNFDSKQREPRKRRSLSFVFKVSFVELKHNQGGESLNWAAGSGSDIY